MQMTSLTAFGRVPSSEKLKEVNVAHFADRWHISERHPNWQNLLQLIRISSFPNAKSMESQEC
jgi:hypothetical protein